MKYQALGAPRIDRIPLAHRNIGRYAEEEPRAVRQKLELAVLSLFDDGKTTRECVKPGDDDRMLSLMSCTCEAACDRLVDQIGLAAVLDCGDALQRVGDLGGYVNRDLYACHERVSASGTTGRGRAAEVAIDAELQPDRIALVDGGHLRCGCRRRWRCSRRRRFRSIVAGAELKRSLM